MVFRFEEGDAVLMRSSEPGKPSYVARVEAIEATDARGSNARVRVRWYYRPEESMGGRRQFHGAKEVFLSDHFDLQSADTIEGKCKDHHYVCTFVNLPDSDRIVVMRIIMFHPSCIGTTIEAAKKLDHFYCEECSPELENLDNANSTSKTTDAKVNTKRSLEVSKSRNKHAKRSG
ncbi:hypothetical protein F2Q68_00005917 [Brassica cretica]|uniref:BAH domain-containing protein n=1 Tax=Brassica cretica TaxID=69181 RepID=A0A8S9JH50_BRACR|nr:hypothetical protein F2Q68_00005917 [Brassica cretica]